MEIATMIICCLVCLIANFVLVILAQLAAMKTMSKTLIEIIDECVKEDKDELFIRKCKEHNR